MPENHTQPVTLAFTAGYQDPSSRFEWAESQAYAVEYSPDPDRLELLPEEILPFVRSDIRVRFHTRYFKYEIGHADKYEAGKALEVHKKTLEKIHVLGEPVVTVHTGLSPSMPVKNDHIVENLSRLVEMGRRLGITVCLENLRKGHSSDPYKILEWAGASGAMITLDTGHALGCDLVMNREMSAVQMVDLLAPRIFEAHVYGLEDDSGHHPILDMTPLKPLMSRLLQTDCRWWTIELHDQDQAMSTRSLVEGYLQTTSMTCGNTCGFEYQRQQTREGYESL